MSCYEDTRYVILLYIILPLFALVFIFLLIFHIPPDAGERMSFGITIIRSIAVSLLVISEKLPEGLDIKPVIGVGFIIVFFILCFALVWAAVAVLLGNRKKNCRRFS